MSPLTVTYGNRHVVLQPGQVVTIGRREDSVLIIDDPRVSREHIRLSWGPHGWVLESIGRAGTFAWGQPLTQTLLTNPVEVQLAAADGPTVRLEPDTYSAGYRMTGSGQPPANEAPEPGTPAWSAYTGSAYAGQPGSAPQTGPVYGPPPPRPGARDRTAGTDLPYVLNTLIPVRTWLADPALRQWPQLLAAVYALLPVVAFALLSRASDLTNAWVYSLYVAPLWAVVFWWLIRPGPVGRMHAGIVAVIVAMEFILIPTLVIPWEEHLSPLASPNPSQNLLSYIFNIGLPEELTKAAPVLVVATYLLKARNAKLDVRMWMFLATLSGLFFGVYEASHYIGSDELTLSQLFERVFVDGLQHAVWAGVAGFFIGLGTNYRRRRYLLWSIGIAIPVVLHGLNDWSQSGVFGSNLWPWVLIQAFSLFLFLGYASSARAIEQQVQDSPIFRGDSMIFDLSHMQAPRGRDGSAAGPKRPWPDGPAAN
jgi:RsiW-degrading membrane proteinase PrsW (M82 family)